MGIRFACHVCHKQLNIKRELAGRRGICPACQSRFRIPDHDTDRSIPIDRPAPGPAKRPEQRDPVDAATPERPATPPSEAEATERPHEPEPTVQVFGIAVDVLNDESTATWYVRPPSGGQYGPADNALLAGWIEEGRVATTALLWRDGWVQWREATEVLTDIVDRLPQVSAVAAESASGSTASVSSVSGSSALGSSASGSGALGTSAAAASASDTSVQGNVQVGANRRSRSMQRLLLITILATLALLLIAVLVYVIQRNGAEPDSEVAWVCPSDSHPIDGNPKNDWVRCSEAEWLHNRLPGS